MLGSRSFRLSSCRYFTSRRKYLSSLRSSWLSRTRRGDLLGWGPRLGRCRRLGLCGRVGAFPFVTFAIKHLIFLHGRRRCGAARRLVSRPRIAGAAGPVTGSIRLRSARHPSQEEEGDSAAPFLEVCEKIAPPRQGRTGRTTLTEVFRVRDPSVVGVMGDCPSGRGCDRGVEVRRVSRARAPGGGEDQSGGSVRSCVAG